MIELLLGLLLQLAFEIVLQIVFETAAAWGGIAQAFVAKGTKGYAVACLRGTFPHGHRRRFRECADLRSTPDATRTDSRAQFDLGAPGDWRAHEMARQILGQKARGATRALHIPWWRHLCMGVVLVRLIVFRTTR